ncbi:metal-sensing transcriptional repressor [Acidaminobacter sp. JC074]|uniref:metal-sensing transcriptional repressor n=1 Tax=Acidaminobacter sp. JC074 TaxID=2530199 RepID=UPI001F0F5F6E|nr:metal-sensing transcriptional repressor [Acidaminobacter sp. JC074]MCH4889739.1 metal-sensing transcriptional repressor [Acidaminobacter sp. JC074]
MSHPNKKAVMARLAKISGHAKSIQKMYEEDRECTEILNQIAAVKSALNSVGKVILKDHINHCIIDAAKSGDEKALEDLNKSIDKLL